MSTGKAFAILMAVIVVVGGFLALTALIGVREYWAGFLFLLQWSLMEEMKLDRLPKSALGAAAGIAVAFLPEWLTPLIGATASTVVMLGIVLVATFLLIKGEASLVANAAMMVFLTVVTIPHILQAATPAGIYLGLAAGLVYFGGLALIAAVAAKRKAAPAAGTAAA